MVEVQGLEAVEVQELKTVEVEVQGLEAVEVRGLKMSMVWLNHCTCFVVIDTSLLEQQYFVEGRQMCELYCFCQPF